MSSEDDPSGAILWIAGSPAAGVLAGWLLFPDLAATCAGSDDCESAFSTVATIIVTLVGWTIGSAVYAYTSRNSDWYMGSVACGVLALVAIVQAV